MGRTFNQIEQILNSTKAKKISFEEINVKIALAEKDELWKRTVPGKDILASAIAAVDITTGSMFERLNTNTGRTTPNTDVPSDTSDDNNEFNEPSTMSLFNELEDMTEYMEEETLHRDTTHEEDITQQTLEVGMQDNLFWMEDILNYQDHAEI